MRLPKGVSPKKWPDCCTIIFMQPFMPMWQKHLDFMTCTPIHRIQRPPFGGKRGCLSHSPVSALLAGRYSFHSSHKQLWEGNLGPAMRKMPGDPPWASNLQRTGLSFVSSEPSAAYKMPECTQSVVDWIACPEFIHWSPKSWGDSIWRQGLQRGS